MRIIRYYPRAWKGDGGIRNSVSRISAGLVRAGAEVSVAIDEAAAPAAAEPFRWLPVHHVGPSRFRRPVGLENHLRDADLLVLHSAWVYHNNYAASIARRLGVPYVLEPRGAYDPCIVRRRAGLKKLWWHMFERRLVQRAAAVHVFFDAEQEHLAALGYSGPTVVAPNGVIIPEGANWDGGTGGYVLWVGRFDPEHKGLDLLLRGMKLLPETDRPQLRLHGPDWVGGKKRTVDLIEALQLGSHVKVGEPVYGQEKWRLITQARAFAYPSRWEGFGNSPAESVAAGVPTLVTPYPFGRWLAQRKAAVMAEATAQGLADGLREVLSPEAAQRAATGRRVLSEEMSWDAVARSWLDQAQAVVARPDEGRHRQPAGRAEVLT